MAPELIIWWVHLAVWCSGFVLLWRIPRCRQQAHDGYPELSVIIPARNEEQRLPQLLHSLAAQSRPPTELIVVDDDSSDRTAAVAKAGGARVLPSAPLPAGWRGKTWACWQGAGAASGKILIFMDADTVLEADGLSRIVDTFLTLDGAVSVIAYHRVMRAYEQLSVFFNLVMTMAMDAFTIWSHARSRGLYGPFLVIRRDEYYAAGGHKAVKEKVLENLYLARRFREQGIPTHCLGGRGALDIRMYPDGRQDLVRGWSKAFASGARATQPRLLFFIVLWLTAAASTLVLLTCAVFGSGFSMGYWGAMYLFFVAQCGWHFRRIGSFHWLTALLYPIPLFFFFGVFTGSALQRRHSWKGRHIQETES
jgi:4,4'-diaponeurosporenoate glycosyltransferase